MNKLAAGGLVILLLCQPTQGMAGSEIIPETQTTVVVREHPRTGKPFVCITSKNASHDPFKSMNRKMKRPDYRMLDSKVKSGQIPYEGPVSDRKKVYLLAASLATIGTVGGTAIIAAAPAATGAGAAGGAGLYAGAGAGIAAGTISGSLAASKEDPERINFEHTMESRSMGRESGLNRSGSNESADHQ